MVQMFNDKKGETSNINALITNRLHALETRLTSPKHLALNWHYPLQVVGQSYHLEETPYPWLN